MLRGCMRFPRRAFHRILPALILGGLAAPSHAAPMFVYFGTYTQTGSQGIYAARFDPADGSLSEPFAAGEAINPTFQAIAPNGRFLYSTGEFRPDPALPATVGGVLAFRIDPATARLERIGQQATGAGLTTYVAVDATGRMVAVANYNGGYVAAVPIRADGDLGPRSAYWEHKGLAPLGPNRDRQKQAYAHSVVFSPNNEFLYSCDLGLDRIFCYRVDPAKAALTPTDPPMFAAPPGSGPRHSKFSADGRFLYVSNEMGGTVCVYGCDPAQGTLHLQQTISTLPPDFDAAHIVNTVAEIRIHPNGRFVYVSNRGDQTIAVYARDPQTGNLSRIEIVNCGGEHPRNFNLSPDGRWLLCANRDTNNVVVFRLDPATGRLTNTGRQIKILQPVCVNFLVSP
jgi:6-phosphogluconolactonase